LERPQVFVVDASVAVKWYVKESLRDKALEMRRDFASGLIELEAPSLLLYEVGNALRHHPASNLAQCVDAVKEIGNLGVVIHELDDQLAATAATLGFEDKLTFYDAVYIALAKHLEATFVTADEKLIEHISEQNRPRAKSLADYIRPTEPENHRE
jgi:predicted nucleic acid-binding protein